MLGFGTVTGPHQFVPDGEYPHRMPVRWDDTVERAVDMPGWKLTLVRLTESTFNTLTEAPRVGSIGPAAPAPVAAPSGGIDFDGIVAQLESRSLSFPAELLGLADVHRVDGRSLARLAAGAEPMLRAVGATRGIPLAKTLRGYLPTHVDAPHTFDSVDTAENRFVRAFLAQLGEIVGRVESMARARVGGSAFWARVGQDCHEMRRALRPMLAHDLWDEVGRFSHLPAASSVLQRRRGYRDVFRHHVLLRAATRLPLDDRLSRLLGMKDVAALYELWCFFAVVRALEQVLGHPPASAQRPRVDDVQVDIPWGLRVSWGEDVAVYYNLTFSQAHGDARCSSSLHLRPDIAIRVRAAGVETMHILDAKLRVERGTSTLGEDHARTFKWSDIAKMHSYRDALPAVRTAFVLYPGDEAEHFAIGGAEPGAVGAIPLVPGAGCELLVEHLRALVGTLA